MSSSRPHLNLSENLDWYLMLQRLLMLLFIIFGFWNNDKTPAFLKALIESQVTISWLSETVFILPTKHCKMSHGFDSDRRFVGLKGQFRQKSFNSFSSEPLPNIFTNLKDKQNVLFWTPLTFIVWTKPPFGQSLLLWSTEEEKKPYGFGMTFWDDFGRTWVWHPCLEVSERMDQGYYF